MELGTAGDSSGAVDELAFDNSEIRFVELFFTSSTLTFRAPVSTSVAHPCMNVNSLKGCREKAGSIGTKTSSRSTKSGETRARGAQMFQYR